MNLPGFSADAALYRSTGAYKARADVGAMRAGSRVASQRGTSNHTPHATAVYPSWLSTGPGPILLRPISFPRAAFPVARGGGVAINRARLLQAPGGHNPLLRGLRALARPTSSSPGVSFPIVLPSHGPPGHAAARALT
jgi:hypothetical protein